MKDEEKARSLLELKHDVYLTYFEIIVISLISFGITFWFGFNLTDQIAALAVKLIVMVFLIIAVIVVHYAQKSRKTLSLDKWYECSFFCFSGVTEIRLSKRASLFKPRPLGRGETLSADFS